jgi:hypothetical protein
MTLSDTVIGHIAQLVQIAILTGTDVVDNMRMIRLVDNEGTLELDEDYAQQASDNVQRMLQEAASIQSQGTEL